MFSFTIINKHIRTQQHCRFSLVKGNKFISYQHNIFKIILQFTTKTITARRCTL